MTTESEPHQTPDTHASTRVSTHASTRVSTHASIDQSMDPRLGMRRFMVRCTLVLVVVLTFLAGSHLILKSKSNRQSPELKELIQFGQRFFELVLPEPVPEGIQIGGPEYSIFSMGTNSQTRYLATRVQIYLPRDKPDHYYSYNLRAQFHFEFKDSRWVMLDRPVFNPERFVDEEPKVFERKLLIENQDIKPLVDYLEAHKDEVFAAAIKAFPMSPPGALK